MSKIRQERTAEQIKQLLSEIFLREVSDPRLAGVTITDVEICLLYTSDAADERSSVDLGGRRIIQKKQKKKKRESEGSRRTNAP